MRNRKVSPLPVIVSVLLAIVAADAMAGGLLLSNRDRALAINAWGGANVGTVLRLHNGCRPNNPDCTWTYSRGMLISDANPGLAISVVGSPQNGAELRLVQNCRPETPACRWTYRDGMFFNDASQKPPLAISASGGARYGTVLKLSDACRADNPDCTWSRLSRRPRASARILARRATRLGLPCIGVRMRSCNTAWLPHCAARCARSCSARPTIRHPEVPPAPAAKAPRIDLNTAGLDVLMALEGITPERAKAIIENRESRCYENAAELIDRKILPKAAYDRIKDKVKVGPCAQSDPPRLAPASEADAGKRGK